jgi:hypothetical protein
MARSFHGHMSGNVEVTSPPRVRPLCVVGGFITVVELGTLDQTQISE